MQTLTLLTIAAAVLAVAFSAPASFYREEATDERQNTGEEQMYNPIRYNPNIRLLRRLPAAQKEAIVQFIARGAFQDEQAEEQFWGALLAPVAGSLLNKAFKG